MANGRRVSVGFSSGRFYAGLRISVCVAYYQTDSKHLVISSKRIHLHGVGRDHLQLRHCCDKVGISQWHHQVGVRLNPFWSPAMLFDQFSSIPVVFSIQFFWVFEVQLLLQIIINQIMLFPIIAGFYDKLKRV